MKCPQFLLKFSLADFAALCFAALVVGMLFAPFLLSISLWFLVGTVLVDVSRSGGGARKEAKTQRLDLHGFASLRLCVTQFGEQLWAAILQGFRNLFRDKALLAMTLLLWLPMLSGLWSDDVSYWLERTRVRIPFFVLPFVFANLPALGERRLAGILTFLVWVMVLTCIGVGINYLVHYQQIMLDLKEGRHIPVPRNHIRFNLILATTILCGGWLAMRAGRSRKDAKTQRRASPAFASLRLCVTPAALWTATGFLFVFIHVLSVRSGLAALYLALIFSLLWFVFTTRKWLLGGALLLGLTAALFAATQFLPSLVQKLSYSQHDWNQFQSSQMGEQDYSDAARAVSLQGGWAIFRANPLLGVGAGDLPSAMQKFASENFPAYTRDAKLPHNQVLYILASTGAIGLIVSLLAFFALPARRVNRFWLFAAFQIIAWASFMVEYTIETTEGVNFYLFFSLWLAALALPEGVTQTRQG